MKENEKRMILILVLVVAVIIAIIHFTSKPEEQEGTNQGVQQSQNDANQKVEKHVQVLDDGTKLNTSTKLNQTKNVNGLEIGNIQLTTVAGQTTLIADVKNNTGRDQGVTAIDITLYDEDNKELVTIGGVIGNVKAGETVKLEASTTLDFANAYDFKVKIK